MAKTSSSPQSGKSASAFDALVSLRKPPTSEAADVADVQTSEQPDSKPSKRATKAEEKPAAIPTGLAKSVDPNYIKFTTYVRKDTHRAVKVKLTERDQELSDLVENLLQSWLQKNK